MIFLFNSVIKHKLLVFTYEIIYVESVPQIVFIDIVIINCSLYGYVKLIFTGVTNYLSQLSFIIKCLNEGELQEDNTSLK